MNRHTNAPMLASCLLLGLGAASGAQAQTASSPSAGVERIPSPGGEVIIPNAGWKRTYDEVQFAPARRIGDTLYVSGVIVFRFPGEGNDAAAFEAQVRRAFRRIEGILKAAGTDLDAVGMINSFHVWQGPDFAGSKDDQIAIINKVKSEFITGPHPAWTAVGTSGLLGEGGIIEIQVIAHLPAGPEPTRP